MGRVRSVAMAGLLPLMTLAPWASQAQPVYQPTQQQAQPDDQQQPPADQAQPTQAQPTPDQQPAQPQPQQPAPTPYTQAQLDQMLAPIALYPDTLLGDILMASTYPIQVVEAERWLQDPHNAAIHGDALVDALQPMTWDPSVKSLVPFPQIVRQMNDKLDWTQSLGTAFTYQQADVMARVQALRHQAEDCGKLTTTAQLKVSHEGPAVVIEPANPSVVYVPVYNPAVVYGSWAYVDYPPFYFPPPPGFFIGTVGVGIGFSIGFGIVDPFWGWGHPAWGSGAIVVNNAYYSRISYNRASFAGATWHHNGPVGFHGPAAAAGFRDPAGFHNAAAFHGAAAARGGFAGTGARSAAARGGFGGSASHAASRGFGGGRSANARSVGARSVGARSVGARSAGGGRSFGGGHAAPASHFGGGGFGRSAGPSHAAAFHGGGAPRGGFGGGGHSFARAGGGGRGGGGFHGGGGGGGHGGGGSGHHR